MPIHNASETTSSWSVRFVIYDLDGLLLDTEQIYSDAMREVVRRYGKDIDAKLKLRIIGRPAIESARYTVSALGLPVSAEEYLRQRNQLLVKRFPAAGSKPGARELVAHLHGHGVKQAVATSSPRELLEIKVRRHRDWFRQFEHIVSVEDADVERGKPAPDVFLAAARKLGASPSECLVFEDSPAGVTAAISAGMPVVAVPEAEMKDGDFAAANQVLDSLTEFEPEPWGLPAF